MSVSSVVANVLLVLAVVVEVGAVAGLVAMRTTMQRLHFVAPAACVGPVLAGAAVAFGTHATPSQGFKGLIVGFAMALFSGVLSHETGRAIVAREARDF